MKTNYYFDLDGVVANFHNIGNQKYDRNSNWSELLQKKGYFAQLKAYENMLSVIYALSKAPNSNVELYIVSAICASEYERTVAEKTAWLQERGIVLDENHLLFPLIGENKVAHVRKKLRRSLNGYDVLLDDYNVNLEEWWTAGGCPIKIVNDFNDQGRFGPLWNGYRIRNDWPSERIIEELSRITGVSLASVISNDEKADAGNDIYQMSKKGNMAYWDEIDALTEEYVERILEYSMSEIKLDGESKEDAVLRIGKEITEFVVAFLEHDVKASFPVVEGDY